MDLSFCSFLLEPLGFVELQGVGLLGCWLPFLKSGLMADAWSKM